MLGIAAVWASALTLLFVTGRGHTLIIDNKNVDGFAALDNIKVSVNGEKPVQFFSGDRDRFFVSGLKARIRIEGKDAALPFETAIRLPLAPDAFILSIPRLLSGTQALEVFTGISASAGEEDDAEGSERGGERVSF